MFLQCINLSHHPFNCAICLINNSIMKVLFHVVLVLSRIETNEATRILDDTHLLLPSLQTRPPVKTPTPNPGTETSVASTLTERNFVGRKQVFPPALPSTIFMNLF